MRIGPKDPQEIKTVIFDFTNQIGTNTLNSATVGVSVLSGSDPFPDSICNGSPTVSATPYVRQRVVGGVLGVSYKLTCVATDNTGDKHLVSAEMDVARG